MLMLTWAFALKVPCHQADPSNSSETQNILIPFNLIPFIWFSSFIGGSSFYVSPRYFTLAARVVFNLSNVDRVWRKICNDDSS